MEGDPFAEFEGVASGEDPFQEFDGKVIKQPADDPFKPFGGQVVKRDATVNVRPKTKPLSQQEVDQQAQFNYYHPAIEDGKTSGNMVEDLIYNHPWLMNLPVVGKMIKDKAYDVATNSGGSNIVPDLSKSREKYSGASLYGDKGPNLLDQYFGKANLPASTYKPTSDYLSFLPSVSIKGDFNKKYANGRDMSDVIGEIAGWLRDKDGNIINNKTNPIDFSKPIYKTNTEDSELAEVLGVDLGSHKTGIAWDKERNLPYVSISDAWDFEPHGYANRANGSGNKSAAYVQASLMQQAGKPFKVYDRFYFDPKTNKYIPDDKLPPVK